MQTNIRKLGNSKAVIIPYAFIKSMGIDDKVDIALKDNAIVITPVKKNPRAGWYDNYQVEKDVDAWQGCKDLDSEQEDWQW